MTDLFRTISSASKGLFKDRGSKFLAFAYPVESEEEIKTHLTELRKEYHDARHHCYAWRLGSREMHFRENDDGEPSNSAGKPILGQLKSRELTNVLVVVIRYFGGTLLGVGGLIHAYRTVACNALDQGIIIEQKVYSRIKLEFSYQQMNAVMKVIKEHRLKQSGQKFELDCSLELHVWLREKEKIIEKLKLIKGCQIENVPTRKLL